MEQIQRRIMVNLMSIDLDSFVEQELLEYERMLAHSIDKLRYGLNVVDINEADQGLIVQMMYRQSQVLHRIAERKENALYIKSLG